MPAAIAVTLTCEHHSGCKKSIATTATAVGKDTDRVKFEIDVPGD